MIETKFRAFYSNDVKKVMVYFEDLNHCWMSSNGLISIDCMSSEYCNMEKEWWKNLSPLMQYTNLKDKNGKEIYDSDILMFHGKNKEVKHPYNLVFWHKERARWALKVVDKKVHPADLNPGKEEILGLSQERLDDFKNGGYYKIIGNMFENPELLTTKKQ